MLEPLVYRNAAVALYCEFMMDEDSEKKRKGFLSQEERRGIQTEMHEFLTFLVSVILMSVMYESSQ